MELNLFRKSVLKHFFLFYKLNIMSWKRLTYSNVSNVLDQLETFKT